MGDAVTSLALSPDGTHLAVCARNLLLRIVAIPSGEVVHSRARAHDAPVVTMQCDSSSTLVATGGADGSVKVWDLRRGHMTHVFRGHGGIISALRFYGDSTTNRWMLATGADDCRVRLWDLVTRETLGVFENHASVIRGLDFTPDGRTLISGSRDRIVSVWDIGKRQSGKRKSASNLLNSILVNEVSLAPLDMCVTNLSEH